MSRLSKWHERKIYPAFGFSKSEGHNFLFYDADRWEQEVFAFLDANVMKGNRETAYKMLRSDTRVLEISCMKVQRDEGDQL